MSAGKPCRGASDDRGVSVGSMLGLKVPPLLFTSIGFAELGWSEGYFWMDSMG